MTAIPPMEFYWDGERLVPRRARMADRHFVIGEIYRMEPREDRSQASHSHYFAAVHDAWQNLPEDLAERFLTPEHLRKWALIKAGYRDERSVACASRAEALRIAAFVRPIDEFAVVTVSETVVTVYTAQSQSYRAMGKKAFQESKTAVLDILAAMVGVKRRALEANAGRAA